MIFWAFSWLRALIPSAMAIWRALMQDGPSAMLRGKRRAGASVHHRGRLAVLTDRTQALAVERRVRTKSADDPMLDGESALSKRVREADDPMPHGESAPSRALAVARRVPAVARRELKRRRHRRAR